MNNDNPFDQDVPADARDRARAFARDFAYGVTEGYWRAFYHDVPAGKEIYNLRDDEYYAYFEAKWDNQFPTTDLLALMGYFDNDKGTMTMTPKALDLLDLPATPPSVFISYRRGESSALGLLIEARLKLVGNPNPFIDKNLVAGDAWHAQLEERIKNCRYFVCLVGKTTLDSPYVRKEIEWAERNQCTIISIWHNDTKPDAKTPVALANRHAIIVETESALGYEVAVNQLLNNMGYATY